MSQIVTQSEPARRDAGGVMVVPLIVAAALWVAAFLLSWPVPFITQQPWSLIGLLLIGMAICSRGGIGRVAAYGDWTHPLSIAGYILGGLILIVAGAQFLGRPVMPAAGMRGTMGIIAALMVAKVVVTLLHSWQWRRRAA